MSRVRLARDLLPVCFPRVSGDEPGGKAWNKATFKFSPRERG